jgi:Zn-dependent metalloprotease/uncharacterized protein YceK
LFFSFQVLAQAQDPNQGQNATSKKLDTWQFTEAALDINGDGIPSLWKYDAAAVSSPAEAVEAVAKQLNVGIENKSGNNQSAFVELRTEVSTSGSKHTRYQQTGPGGFNILGAQLNLHELQDASLTGNGYVLPTSKLSSSIDIQVNADGARVLAEAWIPAKRYRSKEDLAETKVYWVPRNLDFKAGDYILTQRVDVYTSQPLQRYYVYVGAETGEIVAMQNRLHTDDVVGSCETKYSGTQSFTTDSIGIEAYRLYQETSRNCVIHTRNYENTEGPNFSDFFDSDNDWTGTNADQDEVARDAHWGGEQFHDLLTHYFNWNSIDNNGFDLLLNVHFSQDLANAFWDGESSSYGDGNQGSRLGAPLTAIDIVGHEFAHGMTEFSADLIYADESGGLNESFSDIFGVATRFFARPDQLYNWSIGGELDPAGEGIRNMRDPNSLGSPGTYRGDLWQDGAGVHTNSGVQNHWYAILSQGDTATNELGVAYSVEGIGWEDALRVAHLNLTSYLTPSSTYQDAATFSVEAAGVLFGICDDRTAQVSEAWKAVGLTAPTLAQGISFSVSTPFNCIESEAVTFTGSASNGSITWDFGDGTTGSGAIVDHVYAPGTYDVSMSGMDCMGQLETIVSTSAVTVNPFSFLCDTFLLPATQTETIEACGGTLFDPQGTENYANNLNSSLTVLAPNGSTDGFTLTVQQFAVENGFDFLSLYNLNGGLRELIGIFSGADLSIGEEIVTTGEGFIVEFTSDGSVTPDGFRITFESNGGGAMAAAGFSIDNTTNTVYAPFTFTGAASGGRVLYDFGDGNALTADATEEIVHRYAASGTYDVSQIAFSCSEQDTLIQRVTVTAGSDLCANIDTTYITLNQGDSTSFDYALENCGDAPLLLEASQEIFDLDRRSSLDYTISNQTQHTFSGLPSSGIQSVSLEVFITGDFDGLDEFVSVSLDGGPLTEYRNDGDPINGSPATLNIPLSAADQVTLFADGLLTVRVVNSPAVDAGISPVDLHDVRLVLQGALQNNVSFDGAVPVQVGNTINATVRVNSSNRTAGVFRYAEKVQTNDVNLPGGKVEFPIVLTVVGQPAGNVIPPVIDLGDVFIGRPLSGISEIISFGSDVLELTTISTSGDGLTHNLTPGMRIPIGSSQQIDIVKAPTTAGSFSDEILIETNGTNLTLQVVGNAIAAGLLELSENELRDTLAVGQMLTRSFTARNIGGADLNVTSTRGTGTWLSHTSTAQDLAPNTEVTITYSLDATDLTAGLYNSAMVMRSSDPELAVVPIPVFLVVLGPPNVSISVPTENCGADVDFTSTSNDVITSEEWNFGDGNSSTENSPTHTYATGGEFTVTYIACNAVGCDTSSQLITVDLDCSSIQFGQNEAFTSSACLGEFTDSGGTDEIYSNNETSTLLIEVDANSIVKLVPQFFDTEQGFDFIEIFDGDDEFSTSLDIWSGIVNVEDSVKSTSNAMFVRWTSDGSVTAPGFVIGWTCIEDEASATSQTPVGEDFTVQPNPAHAYVEVVSSAFAKTQALVLQDALGRVAQTIEQPAARTTLNTSTLPAGVYMVTLRYEDGSATTKRLVVE